jgi:hypothetical protein
VGGIISYQVTRSLGLWLLLCANSCKIAHVRPPVTPPPPASFLAGFGHTKESHPLRRKSQRVHFQRISGPRPSDPAETRHAAPAAVPAANLGPGTRPEPAPATTHGRGYGGRNSTGGWLADDPQGVPPRPRTTCCGRAGGGGGAARRALWRWPRRPRNEIGNLRCRHASQARTTWHKPSLDVF